MPNIPRLYRPLIKNPDLIHLRVPYKEVVRQIGQPVEILGKMGISPEGIRPGDLCAFMQARIQPLENFPLRQKGHSLFLNCEKIVDFKAETIDAILGRFGEGTLVEKYGVWQDLAVKLLRSFAEGDLDGFVANVMALPFGEKKYKNLEGFLHELDFSGLRPDLERFDIRSQSFGDRRVLRGLPDKSYKILNFLSNMSENIDQGGKADIFMAALGMRFNNSALMYDSIIRSAQKLPQYCKILADKMSISENNHLLFNIYLHLKDLTGVKRIVEHGGAPLCEKNYCHGFQEILFRMQRFYLKALKAKNADKIHFNLENASPLAITDLVSQYDAVVAIARQGLRHAAFVEKAGVPLYILDAHGNPNRKKICKWRSRVNPGQFSGKKILVLENDVSSGGTLQMAIEDLRQHSPYKLDLLLTNPKEFSRKSGLSKIESGFEQVFFLEDIAEKYPNDRAVGEVMELIYRQMAFTEEKGVSFSMKEQMDQVEERLGKILEKIPSRKRTPIRRAVYKNLFHIISSKLENTSVAEAARKYLNDMFMLLGDIGLTGFAPSGVRPDNLIKYLGRQMIGFQSHIAENIYRERTHLYFERLFQKAGISIEENLAQAPHDILETLKLIRQLISGGEYEAVLVIGPEGAKYTAPFEMTGEPMMDIYIDDFDPARPLKYKDDLSSIKGKKILLLEDDIHSGATLKRALGHILPIGPRSIDLFLGNPLAYQTLEKVPPEIKKVHTISPVSEEEAGSIIDWFSQLADI